MDLIFNIIFVPGTVRYLRLAVLSLLKFSEFRYRLIANGLLPAELAMLKEFCSSCDRLEFYAYPTRTTLAHGSMLSLLQFRERGDYFCFMDSDIFAFASFQDELESHVHECDIFSSCSHLGLDPAERLLGLDGRCLQTTNGLPLATTFFCVYRNEPLCRIIAETGVAFERYSDPGHLSSRVIEQLKRLGLSEVMHFDTGKLLNVLSNAYNIRFKYSQLAGLTHIGGIGGCMLKNTWRKGWKQKLGQLIRRPYVLRDRDLDSEASVFPRLFAAASTAPGEDSDTTDVAARHAKLLRRHVAEYFAALFRSLFDGDPRPKLAISDQSLVERIERLESVIREQFSKHRSKLAA